MYVYNIYKCVGASKVSRSERRRGKLCRRRTSSTCAPRVRVRLCAAAIFNYLLFSFSLVPRSRSLRAGLCAVFVICDPTVRHHHHHHPASAPTPLYAHHTLSHILTRRVWIYIHLLALTTRRVQIRGDHHYARPRAILYQTLHFWVSDSCVYIYIASAKYT